MTGDGAARGGEGGGAMFVTGEAMLVTGELVVCVEKMLFRPRRLPLQLPNPPMRILA